MFKHKKIYQPKSLYDICKRNVQLVYKNHWNETKILPKQVQRELLLTWLRCDETIPESDEDVEKVINVMEYGWESMKPITQTMFLYLMRLPNEVPPFAYERNHIIWDYYEWHKGSIVIKLCAPCMSIRSRFYKPYSANLWLDNDWQFKRIQDHDVFSGDELLDKLIWNEENWCSDCISEPLWEHILDDDDCLYDYNYHLRKRRNVYESSSEEDDDIDYRNVTNVIGNRMSPSMYNMIKVNKWWN